MPGKDKKQKKENFESEEELQYHAIQTGLNSLIYSNQGLREYAPLIKNTIDSNKVSYLVDGIKEKLEGKNVSDEQKNKIMYDTLAEYASSGKILKDTTIQTLFDTSQEGKLERSTREKIMDFFSPNRFGGAKYFEKARNTYRDMYDMLSQNKEAQMEMPELTKAAKTMKMYGFLDTTLKNFKAHGMIDEKEFRELHDAHYETAVIRAEKGKRGVIKYIRKEKEDLKKEEEEEKKKEKESNLEQLVASIIGFIGMMFMVFNINMTGAVIGEESTVSIGIIGVFMIFFALLLYLRPLKKSFKK